MAPPTLIERDTPQTIPHAPMRRRLHPVARVAILVILNLTINVACWELASVFLDHELGAITRMPSYAGFTSLYSPDARIAMRCLTIGMAWYLQYDAYDVSALSVLTHAPQAYLISTFYGISSVTAAAALCIEMLSFGLPTLLLRSRSAVHKPSVPLRNRFLLNSSQVQLSNALLATAVYVLVLWAGLKSETLNVFLVTHFDIPTMEAAHLENPVSIGVKVFVAGIAAKAFLLNPSFAAQPLTSGAATPTEDFDPTSATLPMTLEHNFYRFDQRTRTLIQQTTIVNAFLFAGTVQRCMTLKGTEIMGAAGYASMWVAANTIIALWYFWVGDTSPEYEPL
ncbi:hypothetical protein EJ02DRAFT_127831 [Clathrospora elynae]|uniref:Uncharacterized protein n=1 Tax=Clathrospora elynae TaxID=706981 RepID=A0A6A5SDC3_9PLEO|nr:hypothetical protein EJ02DRAFT_127831 [Clathrospora elynae]